MTHLTHICLVEDDLEIAALVSGFLLRSGYRTTHLADGRGLMALLQEDEPDLILLDLLLPGETGLSIARRVRAACDVPIIMLTAMSEEHDRISGLDLGADDYVTKPFSTSELEARIRAVLRRAARKAEGERSGAVVYRFGGWLLDTVTRDLLDPEGVNVEITSSEFEILRVLCEDAGQVLSRTELAQRAQGRRVEPYDRSVDTLISRLRTKIEPQDAVVSMIKTVRNGGYVLVLPVEVQPK